jgi:hypothetical protein
MLLSVCEHSCHASPQVDHAYISVATLTDEPLAEMDRIENAPSIKSIIVGKGEDFANVAGGQDGNAIMPQVSIDVRQWQSVHARWVLLVLHATLSQLCGRA